MSCSTPPKAPTTSAEWDTYVSGVLERYFAANPDSAVGAGRHEYDGKMSDVSKAGIDAEVKRLKEERERAKAFNPATLDDAQKLEREYVIAEHDSSLFWLETAEHPYRSPVFYANVADPDIYVTKNYAPPEQRMKALIEFTKGFPGLVAAAKANLRTPLPKSFIQVGRIRFGGLASFFKDDIPQAFASVKDPALLKEFQAAMAVAIASMKEMDDWLKSLEPTASEDFALGADKFRQMLRDTERVDMPLEELEAAGKKDLQRNLALLKEACAKYAPGKSEKECIALMNANKPKGGAVEGAQAQLNGLKDFVVAKNLVSIPGTELAEVKEAPAYQRSNSAYISIPGPYEKGLPSVYYISPPDPKWTKAERDAYVSGEKDLLFTSVHEVWPGHFLQFLHSNRAKSKFGSVFVGYAFAEGWAHYAEEMMFDQGLDSQAPETHIGQLTNALLRNVRFLSAIGLHTGKMTQAESEKMFLDSGFQDPGNARQQAARGTYDPAYLNYTLGKLMIKKLWADYSAKHGNKASLKEFHDKFLSFGGPPIPLIRNLLLGDASGNPL